MPGREDPQRDAVYAIDTQAGHLTPDLKNVQAAQDWLDRAMTLIGEPPITVRLLSRSEAQSIGWLASTRTRAEAFVVSGERAINLIDVGKEPLTRLLHLFHEATHVLCPTEEAHGPAFVRAWIDLLERFPLCSFARGQIVDECHLRGVHIAHTASRLVAGGGAGAGTHDRSSQ
jgi:hypothetical protein